MSQKTFQELAEEITAAESKHRQKTIAVDGGGGSGKSTFAAELKKHLPNSEIIHIDDFYKGPWDKRLDHTDYEVNPLFDWDRFAQEVIEPLRKNEPITYRVYDWHTHTANEQIAVPSDACIIVEGGAVTQHSFADVYDLKIWIEAPEDLRLQKALVRDGEHMRFLWEGDWLPVERNYIERQNPAARADVVVKGQSGDYSSGIFETI